MKSILQVLSLDLLSKLLAGGAIVIIIRFMPKFEFAGYTLALSIVAFVTQTLTSGFNRIYIVGHQRLDLRDRLPSFLWFQLMLVGILAILGAPFASLVGGVYWFVIILILATCLSEFSRTTLQHELKFFSFSIVEVARTLIFLASLAVLVYVVRFNLRAAQVLLLQALTMIGVFLVIVGLRISPSKLLRLREAKGLAAAVVNGEYRYLFGYFSLLALFLQIDVFMLRAMTNDLELATYGSAFRYYSLLLLPLGAVHVVLLPTIQKAQSVAELEGIFANQRKMLLVFTPLVVLAAWASQWAIPWIDLGRYPNAIIVFRILAVSAIISFAFSPYVNLVMRFEDFKFLFVLMLAALLLHLALNIVLISTLGAIGAAIATLISFGFVNTAIFVRAQTRRTRA